MNISLLASVFAWRLFSEISRLHTDHLPGVSYLPQNERVRVVMAPRKKYIVIQPSRINKGKALLTILHEDVPGFDLILGVGDERTDEAM